MAVVAVWVVQYPLLLPDSVEHELTAVVDVAGTAGAKEVRLSGVVVAAAEADTAAAAAAAAAAEADKMFVVAVMTVAADAVDVAAYTVVVVDDVQGGFAVEDMVEEDLPVFEGESFLRQLHLPWAASAAAPDSTYCLSAAQLAMMMMVLTQQQQRHRRKTTNKDMQYAVLVRQECCGPRAVDDGSKARIQHSGIQRIDLVPESVLEAITN